jgi:two-component system, response regulator / RNA-binding antiterminator
MRVAVVDAKADRQAKTAEALREAGITDIIAVDAGPDMVERIARIDPDVVLIDLQSPGRDVLDQMFVATRAVKRPVAMFVGQCGADRIAAAIDAGVAAYVVDDLRPERVQTVLDLAVSRYGAFARMEAELTAARAALEARKLVDRAKGILMKARGLSEEDAYAAMRKSAMDRGRRISEIAESIVTAAELL